MHPTFRCLPAVLVSVLLITRPASAQAPAGDRSSAPAAESAATYLPAGVFAALTLPEGDQRLRDVRALLDEYEFFETPLYARLAANPQFMQAQVGLLGLAASARSDAWDAVGAALGRELMIGLAPREGKPPGAILVSVLRQPALVDQLLKAVHALTGLERDGAPDPARSAKHAGAITFSISPELHHCRIDDALLVANDLELLKSALDARRLEKPSLAQSESYRAAAGTAPRDSLAWAYADLKAIRAGLARENKLNDKVDNPLGGFLFGGWLRALLDAQDLTAWITTDRRGLAIEARVAPGAKAGEAYRGFRGPTQSPPVALRGVQRYLSEATVARDWAALFAEREALLTLPAASDVVNFNTTVSTLLGGLDFMQDLLPRVTGPVQFMAARQDFSQARDLPTPRLPAFAMVAPLTMDESYAARLFSGALSTLSLINFDQAQKGLPGYLLDMENYRGLRVLATRFADPSAAGAMKMGAAADEPERPQPTAGAAHPDGQAAAMQADSKPAASPADIRYNFAPTFALVADHMVIATSRDLLHDIANVLLDGGAAAGGAAAGAGENVRPVSREAAASTLDHPVDRVHLDVPSLAAILRENREQLVVNRMLEKDLERQTAELDVDQFVALLGYFSALELNVRPEEHGFRARLELRLAERPK